MLRFIALRYLNKALEYLFQYIPCYGLSRHKHNWFKMVGISIHPMLRFIKYIKRKKNFVECISIHPMLRFIHTPYLSHGHVLYISIHPMLRFIGDMPVERQGHRKFQYIPCYGLSHICYIIYSWWWISIHPMLRFIRTRTVGTLPTMRISIHPMLRFIFTELAATAIKRGFQYIPCYGLSVQLNSRSFKTNIFQYIPCYGLSHVTHKKEKEIK